MVIAFLSIDCLSSLYKKNFTLSFLYYRNLFDRCNKLFTIILSFNTSMSILRRTNMTRFTDKIAQQALEIGTPFINQILKQEGRKGISVQIGLRQPSNLESKPLLIKDIGDGSEYNPIAMSKYKITLETGLPSREAQLLHPETTGGEGQTIYWGSWIDGFIIVAISGLPPEWDEVCSKLICGIIKALLTTQSKKDFELGERFT